METLEHGRADWVEFKKTTAPTDQRWIAGVIETILAEFQSDKLGREHAGDPFELLCAVLLEATPGVEAVERVPRDYDWHTDLIGKNGDGQLTWWMQCKLWSDRGRMRYASLNAASEWITKVEQQILATWSGSRRDTEVRAVFVTTATVDPRAARLIDSKDQQSWITFDLWGPEELCGRLLAAHIGFVKSDFHDGAEYVAVDREALRQFRHVAEAELEQSETDAGDEAFARTGESGREARRPRFLPPAERRQALEEVLRGAEEPMPFGELLAKASEWLGLSEAEQRFAEPGKPIPLFEWLMTQALEDMRNGSAAERHSGQRWSLASQGEPAVGGDAQEPSDGVESARPRFLPTAERRQALEEVLRTADEPMPFEELLGKAGEWLGLPEAEQIYTEPGEPVPFFEHLMSMALEDLREEGVAERHSGRRWSLTGEGESAVQAGTAQEPPTGGAEVARPRFLPPTERRQAIQEVLRVAGEPVPFEELLAKAGEWLGLSEGEQRFAEPGKPMPLFEFLISQALEELRQEGAAELQSGRRWSVTSDSEPAAKAGAAQEPLNGGAQVVRPRFLPPAERRQALEEVLRGAEEPLPFLELLAKAGEWLGLSEGEQRFAEPGKPMSLFEFLISQALEDLRQDGTAELRSGRRWSLSVHRGSATEASPAEPSAGGVSDRAGEAARPRFLSSAERQQALKEVLRDAEAPMPITEVLAKAGEWLGVSESEQRYAEPGRPTPLFEHLMSMALEDLREAGVVERHSGQRWLLSKSQRGA